MLLTIQLKLQLLDSEDSVAIFETQALFSEACNAMVPFVQEHRCWNQVALHHHCYYKIREMMPQLGSQMICNGLRKVCSSYRALGIPRSEPVKAIQFRQRSSIHYCARTMTIREDWVSLFTIRGRIRCKFKLGRRQRAYLAQGKPRRRS